MTDSEIVARMRLRSTGDEAVISRDPLVPGAFELAVGGSPQSHVDLGDPSNLFYDYVRRIGAVLDRIRTPGEPIAAVHLGAGALTLARYVQATRPGSEQHVAELADDLVPFVVGVLPLPAGTRLQVHPGDAARTLGALGRGRFDVVLSDLYRGTTTPAHLQTTDFFRATAALLTSGGVLVVNVADDDGLPALRAQLAALASVFAESLVLGPASVLTDARAGNAVIVASNDAPLGEWEPVLRAAGPHPAVVLRPDDSEYVESARPVTRTGTARGQSRAREQGAE